MNRVLFDMPPCFGDYIRIHRNKHYIDKVTIHIFLPMKMSGVDKHRFVFVGIFICFFVGFGSRTWFSLFLQSIQSEENNLRAFTTDATGQLDVFGHDGHTFGVDGSQVGILEQTNQVSLGRFLKGQHGRSLET